MEQDTWGEGAPPGPVHVSLANGPGEEAATTLIKFTAEVIGEGGVSIRNRQEITRQLPPGRKAARAPEGHGSNG